MEQKEIYQFIREKVLCSDRYAGFTLLENSVSIRGLIGNKRFLVQVHDVSPIQGSNETIYVGFAGAFLWADGQIHSLDGDTYNEDMKIYAYHEFDLDNEEDEQEYGCKKGLDILVTDW